MQDDRRAELARLRARTRAQVADSRKLMSRARTSAQTLHQRAEAAKLAAREQLGSTIGVGFPTVIDQGPTCNPLTHENVLCLVLDTAQAFFDGSAAVSMTIVDQLAGDGAPSSTTASGALAEAVDAAQLELREGPGVEAVELDVLGSLHAHDLTAAGDSRIWPAFSTAAVALGVRTALCVSLPWSPLRAGLRVDQHAVAAINIYGREPHAFAQPEAKALRFGTWAASALTDREPCEILNSE